jgi:hypothetical protein
MDYCRLYSPLDLSYYFFEIYFFILKYYHGESLVCPQYGECLLAVCFNYVFFVLLRHRLLKVVQSLLPARELPRRMSVLV